MYLLYGLLSSLSFGISNTYWKRAANDADYPLLVLFRGIIATVFFGIVWTIFSILSFPSNWLINHNATLFDYLSTIALCIVCSLGLVFFLKSMKYASVSITVALSSVNIFAILTAVLFLGERFTTISIVSFLFALTGIWMAQKISLSDIKWEWNKGATYALMASFFWGITYPLFKFISPAVGAIPLSFILELSVTIVALIWTLNGIKKGSESAILKAKQYRHYCILAFLLVGGTFFFNLSIQKVSVLQLNLIGNFQFIVSIMLSLWIYKERLTPIQLSGIGLIFFSLVCAQYLD